MSVAQHLNIKLSEYDQRIRTFIPNYEEMLGEVTDMVKLIGKRRLTILDLGVGTGALAARCLAVAPDARLVGIDADPGMLALAQRRLARASRYKPKLLHGNFVESPLPRCDAIVATLALHHIHAAKMKKQFYAKCFKALRPCGILASGDAFLARHPKLNQREMKSWQVHMQKFYNPSEVKNFFAAWASEDTYFPLYKEIAMLTAVGFQAEVVWRRAPFAVLVGWKKS